MKKRLAVAFTGPSNSGKTTLIVKVANILIDQMGKKVSVIKHDPKDKARFDTEGKDSFKFSQTGASVIVTSPTRTTLFSQDHKDLDGMISMLGDFDILLVEGLKTLSLPRIAIFRKRLDPDYFDVSEVLAIDESIEKSDIPNHLPTLDLNDPKAIIEWILTNAKEV